ncbi:MAG: hypothetical protein V3T81_01145 [Thermoanaerobaculia bacterium]
MRAPTAAVPATLAAVFLLLCGCIPSLHTPYEAGPWLRPPAPVAVAFNPRPPLADIGLELLRERSDGYAVYAFDVPSVGFNRQPGNRVRGRYYRSSKGGKRPLLVLLPIWGSSTYPVMTTVRHLLHGPSAGSLDLVVLEGKRHLFDLRAMAHAGNEAAVEEEIQRLVRSLQATVTDIRRLIEWGRRQPEIDPRRIGIVGYSVSAVVAGLVIGLEPRLAAGALVMTGGHLGEILEHCSTDPNRVRRGLERRLGWSAEEMRRKLAPFLDTYHPVRFAGAVDPASVLFIEAARDGCMTAADRKRYWQALGRPERITIGWTHRLSFLSMTPLGGHATTRKIVDFLHRRLVAPGSGGTMQMAVSGG